MIMVLVVLTINDTLYLIEAMMGTLLVVVVCSVDTGTGDNSSDNDAVRYELPLKVQLSS